MILSRIDCTEKSCELCDYNINEKICLRTFCNRVLDGFKGSEKSANTEEKE